MKKNTFENQSTEQLHNNLKAIKIILGALILVFSLLMIITIFGMLTKEDNSVYLPLFIVALSGSAMIPLQLNSMKKIKSEIASREV
ncbi:hypothetical protein [Roseivirga sp. E12]|uniref:hypothetical protein n=1 Tax=Roseivirga sp. E12 TaxID=2819237 RepID=UPI001ABD22A9|nr:hypothetical protein [Roseivirga sp. E12]MBO3697668.1 hypothetical protein [Roseivirga sp. E12]